MGRNRHRGRGGKRWRGKGGGGRGTDTWNSGERGERVPAPRENAAFEEFYKGLGIVPEEEWPVFLKAMQTGLPSCFRVPSGPYAADVTHKLVSDPWGIDGLDVEAPDGAKYAVRKPESVPWLPDRYAWNFNVPKPALRKIKEPKLKAFHTWLVQQNEQGNVNRQEAVSMIPPMLLDVKPGHRCLDTCSAPGSKTAQIVDALFGYGIPRSAGGLCVANDADLKRCYMLTHQLRRFAGAGVMVTNHQGQFFPTIKDRPTRAPLLFDRVLCDVPCSGDGTMRKAPDMWRRWNGGMGMGLHKLQVAILLRGIELTKPGGRCVYSTCSLCPYENEAVVAEAVRKFGKDHVRVEDVSHMLPALRRNPGMCTWKVRDPQFTKPWYDSYEDIPEERRCKIPKSCFSPASEEEGRAMGLHHCLRLLPHHQNTGGFFVCVFTRRGDSTEGGEGEGEGTLGAEMKRKVVEALGSDPDAESAAPLKKMKTAQGRSDSVRSVERLETGKASAKDDAERLFPVEFNESMKALKEFFGLDDAFDFTQVMRRGREGSKLYYLSKDARRTIESDDLLKLKIVCAGCKIMQNSRGGHAKDQPDIPCDFRISQESLMVVLPHMTRRIVYVNVTDMQNLVADKIKEERRDYTEKGAITTPGAVEALDALGPGSLVIALESRDGTRTPATTRMAVTCWKSGAGRVNLFVTKEELKSIKDALAREVEETMAEEGTKEASKE